MSVSMRAAVGRTEIRQFRRVEQDVAVRMREHPAPQLADRARSEDRAESGAGFRWRRLRMRLVGRFRVTHGVQ